VPNPVARGLAGGRTLSIGVVTQAIDSPFYGAALRGIEEALGDAGYSPLFVSGHWHTRRGTARCIEVLRSRRVDGIIVLTGRLSDDAALRSWRASLPVVVTGRALKAPNLFALDFDNRSKVHVRRRSICIDLGHRASRSSAATPITPTPSSASAATGQALRSRRHGARPGAGAAGQLHRGTVGAGGGTPAGHRTRFSAVFAANDQMAFGAALGLHRRGKRVPDDVSLVGFDDVAGALYMVPPLTTVHHPIHERPVGRPGHVAVAGRRNAHPGAARSRAGRAREPWRWPQAAGRR
jgi:LacI family transcriptional regulator